MLMSLPGRRTCFVLTESTVRHFFFLITKLLQTIQPRLFLPQLWYVTPPVGSGCLTRKTKTLPTGTYCAENISATFIDRSGFIEHLRLAAQMKNNRLVLYF